MTDKLSPVGYIRGGDSGMSQLEHFDNVAHYVMTVRNFVSWLAAEKDVYLAPHPASSRHQSTPPLQGLLDEYFEIDAEKLKQERLIETAHRRHAEQEYPRCVNCTKPFEVNGGTVYLFDHVTPAPMHYFGGYVCSEACDAHLCLATLAKMSDFDQLTHLNGAHEQVERNWK